MAEYNVKMNVKTDAGYDQLYPASKSDIIDFDKTSSNLSSTNVEAAIKEVNTKVNTAQSTANTNKTNIGTLTSLGTDSKTNLVSAINEVNSHTDTAQSTANTANSTANANKTNIGTLSNLKTAIKTNIVNAINSLYDNTIGKTLKSLNEVSLATEEGYYADALVIKELNSKMPTFVKLRTDGSIVGIKFPHLIKIIGTKTFQGVGDYGQLFSQSELLDMLKMIDPSITSFNSKKCAITSNNGDSSGHHFYQPEWWAAYAMYYQYYYPSISGLLRSDFCVEYVTD